MDEWKKTILSTNCKIRNVAKNLSDTAMQICFIKNLNNEFIGTITDGDIRRGLLKGLKLSDNIKKIINRNSKFVNAKCTKFKANQIMKNLVVRHLPIIENKKIIGIHSLKPNFASTKLIKKTFIIMAGGKGLRLKPFTNKIPKPMIKINNKPMMEHLIVKAKNEGFHNFVIVVHHLKDKIKRYFKDGKNLGVKISYIEEKTPLGTAGGLSLLNNKITDNFILSNADVISDIKFKDLIDFHIINSSSASVAVKVIDNKENYGLVKIKGVKVVGFDEKPLTKKFINCGVYVFSKKCLKEIKKNQKIDMISFLKTLKRKNNKIVAFPIYENWHDLGLKKNIKKFM